jgi:DNA-binding transcriptional LysR family regulator
MAPIKRRLWMALTALALAAGPLHAAGVSAPEASEIRSLIEAQLAAFRADDAERAFSYASPSIRTQFGDAATFIAMVRSGYPVVYRPASVAFLLPESADGQVIQRVRLTDSNGAAWLAIYSVERQADKSWRINGCVVTRDSGRTT